ncbi:phage holin family protein [Dialister micraerophilus]|uniref:phage holin family protein n=1 Tax=Dialister micraerophilus TaxID=309120 RepID=UPI0023F2C52B|nr:phage holin family protein [Dialister micraerophilus]
MKGKQNEIMKLMKKLEELKRKIKPPHVWGGFILTLFMLECIDFLEHILKYAISLTNHWQVKFICAGVLTTALNFVQGPYGTILDAFFWLIVIDIATRWIAIGYKYLLDKGVTKEQITMFDKIQAIVLAFDEKILTSKIMLWGFFGKFVLFAILLFASNHIDHVLLGLGIPLNFAVVKFMLAYICYNEILSVAENLRDAGNDHMDKLIEILNANILNKIKK